jgi:stress-induced morphogen
LKTAAAGRIGHALTSRMQDFVITAIPHPRNQDLPMPMPAEEIIAHIKTGLPDAEIVLEDLAGDNDHWKAIITSEAFRGKLRVAQHQMVYATLGSKMGNELHALALETRTPGA